VIETTSRRDLHFGRIVFTLYASDPLLPLVNRRLDSAGKVSILVVFAIQLIEFLVISPIDTGAKKDRCVQRGGNLQGT
jgi:hypothetical protein